MKALCLMIAITAAAFSGCGSDAGQGKVDAPSQPFGKRYASVANMAYFADARTGLCFAHIVGMNISGLSAVDCKKTLPGKPPLSHYVFLPNLTYFRDQTSGLCFGHMTGENISGLAKVGCDAIPTGLLR